MLKNYFKIISYIIGLPFVIILYFVNFMSKIYTKEQR